MDYDEEIKKLRQEIDEVDEQILKNIARRFEVVAKISKLKKVTKQTPLQKNRWEQLLEKIKELAVKEGLSKKFIEEIWNLIHKESLRLQKEDLEK